MTVLCALFLGTGFAVAVERLCVRERRLMGLQALPTTSRQWRAAIIVLSTLLLYLLFYWATFSWHTLETAEVRPSEYGEKCRFVFHLTLIGLLIVATAVDFDCYTIPDVITLPGTIIGLVGACLVGELQICHLWVDWSTAVPQIRGPYIPAWYDGHRFWHACAWSLSGMVTGAGLTAVARLVSSRVLGQEAMGLGDVTLMGMIGSFIGWQAVTMVFLLAPLTGLLFGVLIRMLSGKTYLPYGPWLSIAAVLVLFSWSRLWSQTRLIFSDWVSVAILAAVGGGSFVALLLLLRAYKSIPTRGAV